jgi:D-amino-acid dehydrogenase
MNIAILGAGIIGVTTAYELAADGHQVTVFERHATVAEGASFANAGVVAPGYVTPWAAPGMPSKVLRHLVTRHAPVRVSRPLAMADLAWMRHWLRACDPASYAANRARMQRLAFYSRQRLHEVAARMAYDFERSDGYLVLLRAEKDRRLAQPGLALLRELGVRFHEVTAEEARQIEPALNPDTALAGAIHLPQDEVGNCRQFVVIARDAAESLGARFMFNAPVARIDTSHGATVHIANESLPRRFDALVVCAGVQSAELLKPLGIALPLRPVYGYSISAHIPEPTNAPRSGVMDERFKVAITRMGQRVRVAGSAEIGGRAGADPRTSRANPVQGAVRLVPRRRAPVQRGAGVEGRAPHAARRPAHSRRQRHPRSVAEPGAWLQRLGAVLRLGPGAGRSNGRSPAGHRRRGTGHRAAALKPGALGHRLILI